MGEEHYHIRVKKGHVKRLRFWFAPISQKILDADADWLEDEELSCDNICTKALFYPILRKHFPGEFQWHEEINVMPMKNVRGTIRETRAVVNALEHNYDDPRLRSYKKTFAIDLLVDADEYEEKYAEASEAEKIKAIEEHKDVLIEYYTAICDYLDDIVKRYEPQGFLGVAICAPH
ncbi:MAG: hypothetical protein VZR02_06100 [Lachnospiraceae bacterium]|nr:hypothetical protein [Lachnospiraceae bacterium]